MSVEFVELELAELSALGSVVVPGSVELSALVELLESAELSWLGSDVLPVEEELLLSVELLELGSVELSALGSL